MTQQPLLILHHLPSSNMCSHIPHTCRQQTLHEAWSTNTPQLEWRMRFPASVLSSFLHWKNCAGTNRKNLLVSQMGVWGEKHTIGEHTVAMTSTGLMTMWIKGDWSISLYASSYQTGSPDKQKCFGFNWFYHRWLLLILLVKVSSRAFVNSS